VSIRLQQLLLLLAIALLPIILSGWQSLRQIDHMAKAIAGSTRQQVLVRDRHYMREKVADIGRTLRLTTQSTEVFLERQRQLLEDALASPGPTAPVAILYSSEVAGQAESVEDRRFSRAESSGQTRYVKVDYRQPSFLLADTDCAARNCEDSLRKLAGTTAGLRAIYAHTARFSLWHYAGLANGVAMAYPAHGDYPADYDPRSRPWYREAVRAEGMVWLPLTIDASTGQPVLTAATALRDTAGEAVGATAIDLPLHQLLNFQSSASPWLNVGRLALLQVDSSGALRVVAMKEPLQAGTDWRSAQQTRAVTDPGEDVLAAIGALVQGGSLLLDAVTIGEDHFMVALTALDDSGRSFLALTSPHSAIENAVATAIAPIEAQRAVTLRQYLVGTLLLLTLIAFIAWYFAKRVTAPLIRMSRTAEELAGGNLASRTGLARRDEIGQLSASIDRMADSIEQLQLEQEAAYRDMVLTLTRTLEKKDSYTAAHSGRVTRLALKLGKRIGLDKDTLEILRFGALTHDLGKIGIADAILNKPADLDEAEYAVMKHHPEFSRTIMKPLLRFKEYAEIAGSHHEHWDGSGYPDGLAGEEIHLLARIVAIADAWDSMVGDRVYRKGMPVSEALAILDREKDDGQFDPRLIREFIDMMREEHSPG